MALCTCSYTLRAESPNKMHHSCDVLPRSFSLGSSERRDPMHDLLYVHYSYVVLLSCLEL